MGGNFLKKFVCGLLIGVIISGLVGVYAVNQIYDNPYPIYVNGEPKQIQGYNIDGYSYFKLRDIAQATNKFNVDFQNDNVIIDTSKGYSEENKQPEQLKIDEKKIYCDYLNNVEKIEVLNHPAGDTTEYISVNDLLYYMTDVNNDGVQDLAFSSKNYPNNGLGILTIDNNRVTELITPSIIPYSAGSETCTLAMYDNKYGIFKHRENSADDFVFTTIVGKSKFNTTLSGYHHEDIGYIINNENVGELNWWSIFNNIIPVKFYGFDSLVSTSSEYSGEEPDDIIYYDYGNNSWAPDYGAYSGLKYGINNLESIIDYTEKQLVSNSSVITYEYVYNEKQINSYIELLMSIGFSRRYLENDLFVYQEKFPILMYKKSDIVLSKNGNYITINNSPDYEKVFVSTSPGKSPEDIIKEAQNNIDKLYL